MTYISLREAWANVLLRIARQLRDGEDIAATIDALRSILSELEDWEAGR